MNIYAQMDNYWLGKTLSGWSSHSNGSISLLANTLMSRAVALADSAEAAELVREVIAVLRDYYGLSAMPSELEHRFAELLARYPEKE